MECSLYNNNSMLKEWKAARLKMQGPCFSGKRCDRKDTMEWRSEILDSDFFCACQQSVHLLVPLQLLLSSLANLGQISRQEKGLWDSEVPGRLEKLSS